MVGTILRDSPFVSYIRTLIVSRGCDTALETIPAEIPARMSIAGSLRGRRAFRTGVPFGGASLGTDVTAIEYYNLWFQ